MRFTADRPLSPALEQSWVRAWATLDQVVADAAAASGGTGGDGSTTHGGPLAAAGLARWMAVTALAVFPNTTWTDGTRRDSQDASALTYARARTHLDDHVARDVPPAQLAAACGVSVRALEASFRRHGGTTAAAYPRRARLARAHEDLLAAAGPHPEGDAVVAAVAARWGFPSPWLLTKDHLETYGQSPAALLRGR